MSDVPELDRLLEEADNVRRNQAWTRLDRLFRRSMGCAIVSMIGIPALGLLFGPIGGAVAAVAVVASLLPVFFVAMYFSTMHCFTEPPERDPTKRYKHM